MLCELSVSMLIRNLTHMYPFVYTGFDNRIFFSSILYYTERNNPDDEMSTYYKTVPHSMWITLLNLSGECPLAHYSVMGKIVIGVIGLFATAIFGVPIGR